MLLIDLYILFIHLFCYGFFLWNFSFLFFFNLINKKARFFHHLFSVSLIFKSHIVFDHPFTYINLKNSICECLFFVFSSFKHKCNFFHPYCLIYFIKNTSSEKKKKKIFIHSMLSAVFHTLSFLRISCATTY